MSLIENNLAVMSHFTALANKNKASLFACLMANEDGVGVEDASGMTDRELGEMLVSLGMSILKNETIVTTNSSTYGKLDNQN